MENVLDQPSYQERVGVAVKLTKGPEKGNYIIRLRERRRWCNRIM